MTKLRWILIITIICLAVLVAGYRLTQPEPETVAAAPVPPASSLVKTASLNLQATTAAEVVARGVSVVVEQMNNFEEAQSGYHISYPVGWDRLTLSTTMTLFQAPDGASKVQVEAVGPLPADGLAPFVDRSLGNDIVYSRQLLTVHGQAAERVVAYSDAVGGQKTTFYINAGDSVFVVTGTGEQMAIEMIARSFNAPQLVAQR